MAQATPFRCLFGGSEGLCVCNFPVIYASALIMSRIVDQRYYIQFSIIHHDAFDEGITICYSQSHSKSYLLYF